METQSGADGLATRQETESFVQGVAGRVADSANVRTVYGNPVDRNGTTVIPVASVRYGFGGGTGRKAEKGQEGTGAGGGVQVSPVGYIEICDGKVKFRRIRLGANLLRAFGLGLAALMVARAIAAAVSRRRTLTKKLAALPADQRRKAMGMMALMRALPAGQRRQIARRLKALRRA